jgi:hypothetical protein
LIGELGSLGSLGGCIPGKGACVEMEMNGAAEFFSAAWEASLANDPGREKQPMSDES